MNPVSARVAYRAAPSAPHRCVLPDHFRRSAGALIMVLIIMCVLSVVAASLLLTTVTRYQTTFQSASWQESIVASEAGVDLAINELRKRVVQGPKTAFQTNWTVTNPAGTTYADNGHAFPGGSTPYLLATHTGEGNASMQARVYVDVPGSSATPLGNFAVTPTDTLSSFISQLDNPNLRDPDGVDRSRWWYRIRSLGIAGVSGPSRPNLDKRDNRLRQFSYFTDWRTGQSIASPQVARMVEVIAQPLTNFRNALIADKLIDLNSENVLIDSFDSSKGPYLDPTNKGTMGNIATNGQLINANYATVNGNAMTNNGSVKAGDHVSGQQSSSFYQELTPLTQAMLNPARSYVKSGGVITTDATYTASTDATAPTLVVLDGINLPDGGHTISLAAPATTLSPPPPSYIKLYVQGDIATTGTSAIETDGSVNAIIYFTGNVDLEGDGIVNDSVLPRQLVLNGIQPAANSDGTYPPRTITIATDQDFEGIVYAPNHDLDLNMVSAVAAGGPPSPPGTKIKLPPVVPIGGPKHKPPKGPSPGQDTDHANGYNGIYGAFVGKTITVEAMTHIHYDETLRQAGAVNHYEIVNWFEDNLSRETSSGANGFWW